MKSLKFYLVLYTSTTIVITLLHLLSPVACFNYEQSADTTRGSLFEEKQRLGSTPPSCHNKCNQCHPCMAMEIPSQPSHDQLQPGLNRVAHNEYVDSSPLPLTTEGYKGSNYKPLGWKCSCDDHFFNP